MKKLLTIALVLLTLSGLANAEQDQVEKQGTELCKRTLLDLARINTADDLVRALQVLKAFRAYEDWQTKASLTEKQHYVWALGQLVDAATKGFKVMALRNVAKCPADSFEGAFVRSEESLRELTLALTNLQVLLALAEAGEGEWAVP